MTKTLYTILASVLMLHLAACRTNKEVTKAQAMTQLEAQHLTFALEDTLYLSPIILKAVQTAISENVKTDNAREHLADTSKMIPVLVRHTAANIQDTTSVQGQHWQHTTTENRTQPDTDISSFLKIFMIIIAFSIFLLVIRFSLDKV